MAAREMRSNVESRRSSDTDDGSKKTAGKVVEELGESTSVTGDHRFGRTALVSIRGGKRYRERQQESFFNQVMDRSDVDQRRARGSGMRHFGSGHAFANTHGLRVRRSNERKNTNQMKTSRSLAFD